MDATSFLQPPGPKPRQEDNPKDRTGLVDSDCSFEDIRLRTKSLAETTSDTRRQESLVPGLTPTKTPTEEFVTQPFTTFSDLSRHTDSAPVQETITPQSISVPVYSSQAPGERGYHSEIARPRVEDHRDEYLPLLRPVSSEQSILSWNKSKSCLLKCWDISFKWKVTIVCNSIAVVTIFTLITILAVVTTNPGSIFANILIDNEDMVLLDFYDTFVYSSIKVQRSNDDQCPHCQIDVYSFYPDSLIVTDHNFNKTTPQITATHDGVLLSPHYLLSASYIDLSIDFFPTQAQNTSIEILLFNDLKKYQSFQKVHKPDAHQVFHLQVNEMEASYMRRIKIEVTGYYFVGIRPSNSPITFQSSMFVHQIEYSRSDFPPPSCVLTSTTPCTVPFKRSYTDTYTDTLKTTVLVYSIPPPEVSNSYFVDLNYEVTRGFWTASSIALVSIICVLSLCVAVVCAYWVYLCTCLIRRRKRRSM